MSIINLKQTDFDGSYLKNYINNIVIILFKAEWCKYCVEFKPLYNELSIKYKSKIIFAQVDIDAEKELLNNINSNPFGFAIKTYPTVIIYKQGYYLLTYKYKREKDIFINFLNNITNINNNIIIKGGIQNNKIAIIVPYFDINKDQNREQQLNIFYPYMIEYLERNNIFNFHIFIIEQYNNNNNKFNKGKLVNAGFDIIESDNQYNSFIFHDIDLLPDDDLSKYYSMYPNNPIHIAKLWDRYNTNPKYLGGIISFNKNLFKQINGFPNNFWNWGGEDDSLYNRIEYNKINIIYPKSGNITDLEEMDLTEKLTYLKENNLKNNNKWELLKEDKINWKKNGLNNLKYKIIKTSIINKYVSKITININI
jgi:thiol-disulfide isomerase/thioredoxin